MTIEVNGKENLDTGALVQDGTIAIVTQANPDISKLITVVPRDQVRLMELAWDGPRLMIRQPKAQEAVAAKVARIVPVPDAVKGLADTELDTALIEKGVKLTKGMSRQTKETKLAELQETKPNG